MTVAAARPRMNSTPAPRASPGAPTRSIRAAAHDDAVGKGRYLAGGIRTGDAEAHGHRNVGELAYPFDQRSRRDGDIAASAGTPETLMQ